jgi:hypothetical protein
MAIVEVDRRLRMRNMRLDAASLPPQPRSDLGRSSSSVEAAMVASPPPPPPIGVEVGIDEEASLVPIWASDVEEAKTILR